MRLIPSFQPAAGIDELARLLSGLLSGTKDGAVERFEAEFARYNGVRHAVNVPSARWGLYFLLKAMGCREGDEVILPAFTYFAVPAAVVRAGLKPVFVDVLPGSLLIDPSKIEAAVTPRTRAVIPTHLCGFVCDMAAVKTVAGRHGIKVIEDCAQTVGAAWGEKKAGSLGDAAYYTFSLTKNFTTLTGAMVVTDDDALAAAVRRAAGPVRPLSGAGLAAQAVKGIVMNVATSKAVFPLVYAVIRFASAFGVDIIDTLFRENELQLGEPPKTGRLHPLQAEMGLRQLAVIDERNAVKAAMGRLIYARLKGIDGVTVPALAPEAAHIFSSLPILVKDKAAFRKRLLANGIDVSGGYMQDCGALAAFSAAPAPSPNATAAEREVLYLPLFQKLSDYDIMSILKGIENSSKKHETTATC